MISLHVSVRRGSATQQKSPLLIKAVFKEGVVLGADSKEGVASYSLQLEREEHPQPPSNLKKVVVIRVVPSCRNAVS